MLLSNRRSQSSGRAFVVANALLTDNLDIQWITLTPFTGRCRSNRRGEEALDTATVQEDNRIPPRSLECHQDVYGYGCVSRQTIEITWLNPPVASYR